MRTPPVNSAVQSFQRAVLRVVSRIPVGRVATYGDVAAMCGRPRAARAVGNILRSAKQAGLPYHRVVAAEGRIGGYGSWPHIKESLLEAEGLTIRRRRILDFGRRRWRGRL